MASTTVTPLPLHQLPLHQLSLHQLSLRCHCTNCHSVVTATLSLSLHHCHCHCHCTTVPATVLLSLPLHHCHCHCTTVTATAPLSLPLYWCKVGQLSYHPLLTSATTFLSLLCHSLFVRASCGSSLSVVYFVAGAHSQGKGAITKWKPYEWEP